MGSGLVNGAVDFAFHAAMRTADRLIDRLYGVSTAAERRYDVAAADQTRHGDPEMNMPSYYLRLLALRRVVAPSADDVLIDLGCGTGRVLFVFARLRLRAIRGIDFHGEACRHAAGNVQRLHRRRSPVEIAHADAAAFAFSDETILYLFNPFGRATLRAVVENLRASLVERPRRVRIAYYHPLHADLFDSTSWLRRAGTVRGFKTDIAIFETRTLSPSNLTARKSLR